MPVAEDSGRTVSSVHMQPEIMSPADFGNRNHIVNSAGVGGSSRSNNTKRSASGARVFLDCGFQLLHIHLYLIVDPDTSHGFAAQSQQPCSFIKRVVRFRGSVKDRLCANGGDAILNRLRKVCRQGQCQSAEVGFVSAACKSSIERTVPAHA